MGYIMKAETSGNSSFPYEYLILWFEKVQKYKMYLILMWPPGERVKGDFVLRVRVCVCARALRGQKGEHAIKNVIFPIFKRKYFVRMRHAVC